MKLKANKDAQGVPSDFATTMVVVGEWGNGAPLRYGTGVTEGPMLWILFKYTFQLKFYFTRDGTE